jgi:hypothetical protein
MPSKTLAETNHSHMGIGESHGSGYARDPGPGSPGARVNRGPGEHPLLGVLWYTLVPGTPVMQSNVTTIFSVYGGRHSTYSQSFSLKARSYAERAYECSVEARSRRDIAPRRPWPSNHADLGPAQASHEVPVVLTRVSRHLKPRC